MTQKSELKAKKKAQKEKEAKVLFKFEVTVLDNNNIQVHGPIEDPLLIMRMLAGAMHTVVDHNLSLDKVNSDIEKGRKKQEQSRIVGMDGNALKAV